MARKSPETADTATATPLASADRVNAPRFGPAIVARIDQLAAITDEPGKLTRLYLNPAHRHAVAVAMQWMRDAGMSVHLDATGSVIGRYEASAIDAPALLLGSHLDSVRDAGRFDGTLGVLAAIAVVERLHASGKRMPFAIEVVAFGDEEGVRFASTLGGSRALAGLFDAKLLDELDGDGISRRRALEDFGCDPGAIAAAARPRVLGYVELHIEQGPVLEAEALPVGVVTAINGANRGSVTVKGVGGHAGTVPMAMRRDALSASAEMILAIERRAAAEADLVATVGRLEVANGATNTVPGVVSFTLDVRHPADARRQAAVREIEVDIRAIAQTRGVEATVAMTYDAPAATCDPALTRALADSIGRHGLPVRAMPSGAGHDGMAFRGRIPFAMLFVRCRGGISHNPAEFAATDDIEIAARVLEDFVAHFVPEV